MNNSDSHSDVTAARGGGVSLAKPPGYQLDALRHAMAQAEAAGHYAQADQFNARYGRLALDISFDEFVAHLARTGRALLG
ncbi:hypothetical protein F5X71_29625 [Nocardia brasiliensis]|uniref:Uncharacterized protein n=1 Tax=Nocardia brasiliensis TaxID=37326 RepID=A0A6G9XYC2_NOCBR|nr:hypothetical protein [Nocardia brasiliensis]QIS05914.1 hypothetical protein F5X71_29625 [Nocardia brasiliensis]